MGSLRYGVGKAIHVVTHPEATHHCEGLVGGRYESDLTATGLADVTAIARWLREQISAGVTADIFSSTHCVPDVLQIR